MDATTKKACFDEISHTICDTDKKVNISEVSNNWHVTLRESEQILLNWLQEQENQSFAKEYLIRGVDKNGNCIITIVPEKKLPAVELKCKKIHSSLYSIEKQSSNQTNRLEIPKISECKMINLPLKCEKRASKVVPIAPTATTNQHKSELKPVDLKKSSIFSSSVQSKQADTKPIKKDETTPTTNKKEDKTPSKDAVKNPNKESDKKKDVKKGKPSSISSFFSSKPDAKKPTTAVATKEAKIEDDEEMMVIEKSVESVKMKKDVNIANKGKRSIDEIKDSGDEVSLDMPEEKKVKPNASKKLSQKHSRILEIVDSCSDDDEEKPKDKNGPEDELFETSPIKMETSTFEFEKTPPKMVNGVGLKRKAKRTITKTYEDDQGYIITTKEIEEFSCSEPETEEDVNKEKTSTAMKKLEAADVMAAKKQKKSNKEEESDKPAAAEKAKGSKKKITPPKDGTKQGSILSFFSKK